MPLICMFMYLYSTMISPGDRTRSIMQFSLASNGPDGEVNGVTLTAGGTGWDDADLTGITVYWDANSNGIVDPGVDMIVGTASDYATDNGEAVVAIEDPVNTGLPFVIATGTTADFVVEYDFKTPLPSNLGSGSTFSASIIDGSKVRTLTPVFVFGSAIGKEITVTTN